MAKTPQIDPEARRKSPPRGGLESIEAPADDPFERIEVAREAMIRQIEDHFGRDPALLKAVEELAITSEEAIEILDSMPDVDPSPEQISSLEAIVMFDGTRPSFLVKDHQIDFASSYNTGPWQTELQPHLHALTSTLPCIGRVELGERHIGTAFLVTTTLAITNRHVAQSIARFDGGQIVLKPNTFLDFGREQWNGKTSFDRRRVESIVFAGSAPVAAPIDHKKLDLAVVRVSESKLDGDQRNRSLSTTSIGLDEYLAAGIVAAAGYPASPDLYVPTSSSRNTTRCSIGCWKVKAAPSGLRLALHPISWGGAGRTDGRCVMTRRRSTATPAHHFFCLDTTVNLKTSPWSAFTTAATGAASG